MKRREAIKTALKGLAFIGACAVGVKATPRKEDKSKETTHVHFHRNEQFVVEAVTKNYRAGGKLRDLLKYDLKGE